MGRLLGIPGKTRPRPFLESLMNLHTYRTWPFLLTLLPALASGCGGNVESPSTRCEDPDCATGPEAGVGGSAEPAAGGTSSMVLGTGGAMGGTSSMILLGVGGNDIPWEPVVGESNIVTETETSLSIDELAGVTFEYDITQNEISTTGKQSYAPGEPTVAYYARHRCSSVAALHIDTCDSLAEGCLAITVFEDMTASAAFMAPDQVQYGISGKVTAVQAPLLDPTETATYSIAGSFEFELPGNPAVTIRGTFSLPINALPTSQYGLLLLC